MLAEVAERDVLLEQSTGRLSEQHLTAVGRSRHPRRLMDVEPDVTSLDQPRLTRVQADANADLVSLGPLLRSERTLRIGRGRHRLACRLKGDEEGVALAFEDVAAVALESPAQECAMQRQLLGIPVPQPPEQTRRALDVSEQERDGAARRLTHRLSIAPGRFRVRCRDGPSKRAVSTVTRRSVYSGGDDVHGVGDARRVQGRRADNAVARRRTSHMAGTWFWLEQVPGEGVEPSRPSWGQL